MNNFKALEQQIARQREFAQRQLQSSQAPVRGGMVGDIYVKASPLQHLAQVGKAILSQKDLGMLDERQAGIEDQKQTMFKNWMSKFGPRAVPDWDSPDATP